MSPGRSLVLSGKPLAIGGDPATLLPGPPDNGNQGAGVSVGISLCREALARAMPRHDVAAALGDGEVEGLAVGLGGRLVVEGLAVGGLPDHALLPLADGVGADRSGVLVRLLLGREGLVVGVGTPDGAGGGGGGVGGRDLLGVVLGVRLAVEGLAVGGLPAHDVVGGLVPPGRVHLGEVVVGVRLEGELEAVGGLPVGDVALHGVVGGRLGCGVGVRLVLVVEGAGLAAGLAAVGRVAPELVVAGVPGVLQVLGHVKLVVELLAAVAAPVVLEGLHLPGVGGDVGLGGLLVGEGLGAEVVGRGGVPVGDGARELLDAGAVGVGPRVALLGRVEGMLCAVHGCVVPGDAGGDGVDEGDLGAVVLGLGLARELLAVRGLPGGDGLLGGGHLVLARLAPGLSLLHGSEGLKRGRAVEGGDVGHPGLDALGPGLGVVEGVRDVLDGVGDVIAGSSLLLHVLRGILCSHSDVAIAEDGHFSRDGVVPLGGGGDVGIGGLLAVELLAVGGAPDVGAGGRGGDLRALGVGGGVCGALGVIRGAVDGPGGDVTGAGGVGHLGECLGRCGRQCQRRSENRRSGSPKVASFHKSPFLETRSTFILGSPPRHRVTPPPKFSADGDISQPRNGLLTHRGQRKRSIFVIFNSYLNITFTFDRLSTVFERNHKEPQCSARTSSRY